MAVKKKIVSSEANFVNKVLPPKFVGKANQWCVTEVKGGKQLQHWFGWDQKEKAIEKYNLLSWK